MPDPYALAGSAIAIAVVAVDKLVAWRRGSPTTPQPNSTILPPPPLPSQPSLTGMDGAALAGRVVALEQRLADWDRREGAAQAKREEMAEGLIRIETKLDERTTRRAGGSSGSTRESR